eukprot:g1486.t1
MTSSLVVPYGGRVAGSVLGIARENDEGALRALCQVCSTAGVAETRKPKKCVLVTIYRRESDLFALQLRERHSNGVSLSDGGVGGGANGRGRGSGAQGLTVLCDMAIDDGVHLERPPHAPPLVVKVVNTCRRKNAYLLEFGRKVDLSTFQGAFTAARGYFRQMLTLRSLVADSFWQGFASGAGGPVRNEPYGPLSEALKPPPGVVPGAPEAGLRGKADGPGAGGLDAETLAAKVSGQWSPAEGVDGGASSPRARSPGTKVSASLARGGRAGGTGGGDEIGSWAVAGSWGAAAAAAAARAGGDKTANALFNRARVDQKGRHCHKCQQDASERPGLRFECPNGKASHVYCGRCLDKVFSVEGARDLLWNGTLRHVCPVCEGFCPCKKCEGAKPRGPRGRKQANGGAAADHDERGDVDPSKPLSLVQYLPAPQLSHYEGLFAKYLQSLPALERVSTTEDVCFLCKEGGNLVECDKGTSWYRRVKAKLKALGKPAPPPGTAFSSCGVPMEEEGDAAAAKGGAPQGEKKSHHPPRCKKVYHAYCMGFNVADDELSSCPRHACVECAESATFFCRFCPVSLCDEHYRTDPSGIVAETYDSLQHRVRRPFPRTRGGGFRKPSAPALPAASGSRGGGGGRKRGHGDSGGGGGSGRKQPRVPPAGDNIAHNRPRRGQATAPPPAYAGTSTGTGGRRGDVRGAGGGGSGGKAPPRDKRSCGVGEPGGAGFGESDFVCSACKMAARRAIRQYGLMGSLETGGVVLPYGESEESGDENESAVKPITALFPREGTAASSSPSARPASEGGLEPGNLNGATGRNAEEGDKEMEAVEEAEAPSEGGDGSGGNGGPRGKQSAAAGAGGVEDGTGGDGGGHGVVGCDDDGHDDVGAAAAAAAASAAAAPAGDDAAEANATANKAAAALAAKKYFSMFSRRGGTEEERRAGGSAAKNDVVSGGGGGSGGGAAAGGGCVEGGERDVEMG